MIKKFPHRNLVLFVLAWVGYFSLFWSKAFWFDKQGNFVAGHVNIWGDWAAHFTMGSHFAYQALTNLNSPLLAGDRLSYPFVANWLPAVLVQLGFSFVPSFVFLSFLASVGFIVALVLFYKTWFQKTSLAILATLFFVWNGGMGFLWYLGDVVESPRPLYTALNPPHEYTRLDEQHIKWISVIDSMVIPQRAFTLGFSVAVLLLVIIWQLETAMHRKSKVPTRWQDQKYARLAVGVGLGVLPIIHTHSFLAVTIILACWSLGTLPKKASAQVTWFWRWLIIAIPAALLSAPLYFYFFASHTTGHFMKWLPGWYATDYGDNWIWWWLKNWGLVPLLAALGSWSWIRPKKNGWKTRLGWILPFWLFFILINLVLLQPFIWDNTKLLVWSSLGFSGLAAYFLHQTWLRWRKPAASQLGKIVRSLKLSAVVIVTLSVVASGALDSYWIIRTDLHNFIMYSAEEWQLAEWTRENTPADSVWLTGDQHNHWLFNLTGRQTVMAYRGWLWTHGYNYRAAERDVSKLYADPTHSLANLEKYNVSYVVVGPNEINDWKTSSAAWDTVAKLVYQTENYRIYTVQKNALLTPTAQ